jgi:hypothetical protein
MVVCGQEFNAQVIGRIHSAIESDPKISRRSLTGLQAARLESA